MSRWFRHYAGMMRDDKLVRVAIRSKQTIERVVWVWGAILESAAEIDDAGRYDFDAAEAAYFLRADQDELLAIEDALSSSGRVAAGCVVKWGDRQFQSDRSAERQRRYRERKRDGDTDGQFQQRECQRDERVTSPSRHGDAPETETETETQPSPAKASEGKARKRAAPAPEKHDFEVPDWVPTGPWQAFVEMRRELQRGPKKIPFTVGAAKGIISDLSALRAKGYDLAPILMKSAIGGYRGVFEPDHDPATEASATPAAKVEDQAAYLRNLENKPWMTKDGPSIADVRRTGNTGPPRSIGQLAAGIAGNA